MAGVIGNVGQTDYAAANGFVDGYLRSRAQRGGTGKSLALAWPLWQAGGMQVDEGGLAALERQGLAAMPTELGLDCFYRALNSSQSQLAVLYSQQTVAQDIINKVVGIAQETTLQKLPFVLNKAVVEQYLKQVFSDALLIPAQTIKLDAGFEKFGIDSVMVLKLTGELEKRFGSLSKTLLFEYQTIVQLSEYFIKYHAHQLAQVLGGNTNITASDNTDAIDLPKAQFESRAAEKLDDVVAVIGLAGKYPGANNTIEFWSNLENGVDSVGDIPASRWDNSPFYDSSRSEIGKIYSNAGGFIEGVYNFDSLFFKMSPREAEVLDPQERLFLQTAYHTLEDAGYTSQILADSTVGVYVGVMYEEYILYGRANTLGQSVATTGNPASIANRVSHYFNFNGPSIALDTMCSSSLTTVHMAAKAIRNGECELALAGGVNISIHPNKYILLSQSQFIARDGKCKSFAAGGEGYVPGEGVGAVLLKSLKQAQIDGDNIYATILGSAINHGGKTHGYTVPNPKAQAQVISDAIKEAGIDACTITYLEAHGTGTSLGDPIEIRGLCEAFGTPDKQFCAIGSVKSNIGHCESAAGIAALTKVLLQLKHKKIAPSLHSEQLNPNIDFINSPFKVAQRLLPWTPLYEGRQVIPRRAGVSSFGAGGANAHLIVEEYSKPANESVIHKGTPEHSHMIVLSAVDKPKLSELLGLFLQQLSSFAVNDELQVQNVLRNIAYTLQVGRVAMVERIGFIVDTVQQLRADIERYLTGNEHVAITGNTEHELGGSTMPSSDSGLLVMLQEQAYDQIVMHWCQGVETNWQVLYDNGEIAAKRVSLQLYPFENEQHCIKTVADCDKNNNKKDSNNKIISNALSFEDVLDQLLEDVSAGKITANTASKMMNGNQRHDISGN
ncbi:Polyketide synthase PksL [Pseudoalteromonas holothuriae]|uniref:Polyketide synthase PksL n=2 Tax=Pseudoalteromonas holothuriae TaxID=2963714 RepID=A0ABN8UVQ1_9GAMM|nr:Polyketide synthase PksL [Pseudoalteromonas sp. CIP111951]